MTHKPLHLGTIIAICLLLSFNSLHGQEHMPKTIMITAPQNYAVRFQEAFQEKEYEIISIPCIETILPQSNGSIDSLLTNIDEYDYVVFSSRRAIDAFAEGIRSNNLPKAIYESTSFCAIGKDAEYVWEKLGVKADVIPEEPSLMGIALSIEKYDKDAKERSIAILAPEVRGMQEPNIVPDFIAKLTEMGTRVTRINAYYTQPADIQYGIDLIRAHKVDCIAFTSGGEIEALLTKLDSPAELSPIVIACYGKYTADFARRKGLNVTIEGTDYSSFSGFVDAIHHHYTRYPLP